MGSEVALKPGKRLAAYLDAQGRTAPEIASVLGFSRQTISGWRQDEEYIALRTEFESAEIAVLEPLVHRAKTELLDLFHTELIPHLRQAIHAVNDNGDPSPFVRNDAAKIIASLLVQSGVLGANDSDGGRGGTAMQQVVQVYFPDHPPEPAIEGTAIEVTE
jgi:transcriptional regulator with XRE-family HTH domain